MIFNFENSYGTKQADAVAVIHVDYPSGSVCTCTDGTTVLTAGDTSGRVNFLLPNLGSWLVQCSTDTELASESINLVNEGSFASISLAYTIFISEIDWSGLGTYGTDYQFVYDDDTTIPESAWPTASNWKCRVLSSGSIVPSRDGKLDIFLVGGGGGSLDASYYYPGQGGAGYTTTELSYSVTGSQSYAIEIGAGGKNANGGQTSFSDLTASGGIAATKYNGGNGGSGGAGRAGTPGRNGGNGGGGTFTDGAGTKVVTTGGTGQGTTTGEFGDSTAKKYASGGNDAADGYFIGANSGNGGTGTGYSGIVVIRNAR